MGAGDWNDSFNQVGVKGKGESVWLSQFAAVVLDAFSALLEALGEGADVYRTLAKNLRAISEWLGAVTIICALILTTGEKWGRTFAKNAVSIALPKALPCSRKCLIKCACKPPFKPPTRRWWIPKTDLCACFGRPSRGKDRSAGYVASYPPGVRENGGQYTTLRCGFAARCLKAATKKRGEAVLSLLNPLNKDEAVYKTEPYYFAGDVLCGGRARARWLEPLFGFGGAVLCPCDRGVFRTSLY